MARFVIDNLNFGIYSLALIFVLLGDQKIEVATAKAYIDKSHLEITSSDYAHFKFAGTFKSQIIERRTAFESKGGEPEKATVKKL